MEKTISPAKSGLPYGVVFGVIMILEFIIAYTLDLDAENNAWVGVMNNLLNFLVLPVLFIAIACNHFKNKLNGGYITFGQCLKAGVTVTAIAALVFGIFNIIFNIIFPDFQEEMFRKTAEAMAKQNPNMSSEQMRQSLEITKTFMKPYITAPFLVVIYSLVGLVISLIVGAIVKKENPGAF